MMLVLKMNEIIAWWIGIIKVLSALERRESQFEMKKCLNIIECLECCREGNVGVF